MAAPSVASVATLSDISTAHALAVDLSEQFLAVASEFEEFKHSSPLDRADFSEAMTALQTCRIMAKGLHIHLQLAGSPF